MDNLPGIFICTNFPDEYNSVIINELVKSGDFTVAGLLFTKSFAGDNGLMIKIRRMLSFGVFNLARIALQFATRRTDLPKTNEAAKLEKWITETGTPVLTLEGQTWKEAQQKILAMQPTLVLLIHFNKIIPGSFLKQQPNTYNIHLGKLPERRGAWPVFWTLLCDDEEAYASLHQVEKGIDTGAVVCETSVPAKNRSIADLMFLLSEKIGKQVPAALQNIVQGTVAPRVQNERNANYFGRPAAPDFSKFLKAGKKFY